MYKINDYIVYRHDVCKIKKIKKIKDKDYYVISPIDDNSLIINTPADNKMGYIRDILSKEEAKKIIDSIKDIKAVDSINEKNVEATYKELLNSYSYENLIKIIKTTYERNNNRLINNKKISEKDDTYFKLAEKYLYNELAISLNTTSEEIKDYIINKFKNE